MIITVYGLPVLVFAIPLKEAGDPWFDCFFKLCGEGGRPPSQEGDAGTYLREDQFFWSLVSQNPALACICVGVNEGGNTSFAKCPFAKVWQDWLSKTSHLESVAEPDPLGSETF